MKKEERKERKMRKMGVLYPEACLPNREGSKGILSANSLLVTRDQPFYLLIYLSKPASPAHVDQDPV
jgi:hypothetical protein